MCGVGAGLAVLGEVISYTNGAAAVYGSPSVEGDTLLFNPTAFSSRCSGSQGVDMIDGLMRVWIASSENIEKVTVNEGGAWFFFGPGTAATQAYVETSGLSRHYRGERRCADGRPEHDSRHHDVYPLLGNVGSRTFKATEPVDSAGWQGTMTFDNVDAALVGTPYQGQRVHRGDARLRQRLGNHERNGTVAFIDKKWVAITTTPEPEAFVILVEVSCWDSILALETAEGRTVGVPFVACGDSRGTKGGGGREKRQGTQRSKGAEKSKGRRRGQAKSPLGRQSRLSPQR